MSKTQNMFETTALRVVSLIWKYMKDVIKQWCTLHVSQTPVVWCIFSPKEENNGRLQGGHWVVMWAEWTGRGWLSALKQHLTIQGIWLFMETKEETP